MGDQASCTVRFEGKTARGTARLEHKDLIVRGPIRLTIPLAEIREARADDGTLHLRFGDTRAELEIGEVAARWARRITNPPSRLDKLGVKPGMAVAVLGVDDDSFRDDLERRGAIVSTRRHGEAAADLVFYAANRRDDLGALKGLTRTIKPAGAIWVVRPKGQPAVTEADAMAAGKQAGLVDVKVVSFSATHTAEKFVIPLSARPRPAAPAQEPGVRRGARRSAPPRSPSPSPRTRGSASSRGRT